MEADKTIANSDRSTSHMELLMEKSSSICIQTIIDNIVSYLTGNTCKNVSLVKVSNNNLSTNGELYFSPNLKVWKSVLQCRNICDGKCATILEHFLHVHSSDISDKTETDVAKQVLELLILSSCNWQIKIERYLLEKERVCLFLHRTPLITDSIKAVIHLKHNFGKPSSINKVFSLKIHEDEESELTTARLRLIQRVTENVLNLHGCRIGEEDPDFKLVFTSKSQGNTNENYIRCVCGVAKNINSNTKETIISWNEYIRSKIKELEAVNDEKFCELYERKLQADGCFFENVAKAMITFQLLSVKPSRSIVIGCNSAPNRAITNMKDASFILYNTVRITAIIEKYNDERSVGKYPDLPNIDDVNFSLLDDEEEWELIYNFIIGYQAMIKDCLKYEPVFQTNPQVICIFLSRLCQKFSIYYRRVRILTKAYDHLFPRMIAQLYMLHALQIVLENALALLNIVPVARM